MELICSMLKPNPADRPTSKQIETLILAKLKVEYAEKHEKQIFK